MNKEQLSGKARGFRCVGQKLLPCDAHEAMEASYADLRNARLRKIEAAKYAVHYDSQLNEGDDARLIKTRRLLKSLSSRHVRRAERFYVGMTTSEHPEVFYKAAFLVLSNPEWKYFLALDHVRCVETAMAADQQLLSYARG
jgi:hypothetical protein